MRGAVLLGTCSRDSRSPEDESHSTKRLHLWSDGWGIATAGGGAVWGRRRVQQISICSQTFRGRLTCQSGWSSTAKRSGSERNKGRGEKRGGAEVGHLQRADDHKVKVHDLTEQRARSLRRWTRRPRSKQQKSIRHFVCHYFAAGESEPSCYLQRNNITSNAHTRAHTPPPHTPQGQCTLHANMFYKSS